MPLDSHVGLDRHDCSVPHPPGRAPTPRPIHRPHRRAPRPRAAHRLTPPLPPARAPYHHPRAHARAPPALRPTGLPRALLAIGVGPISWTPDSLGRRCPPCRNRDRRAREARRDGGEDEEWRKGRGETFIRHSPPCGARWCEGSRRAREACRDGWRGRRSGGEEEKPLSGTVPLAGCARVKEAAGHGKHVVTGEDEEWRKGGGETLIRHSPPCGGRWCEGSRRAREACRDGGGGGVEERRRRNPYPSQSPLRGGAGVKEAAGHGKHVVTGEEEAWRKGGGETLIRHSPPCGGALV